MKWLKFFRGSGGQAGKDSPQDPQRAAAAAGHEPAAAVSTPVSGPDRQVLVVESNPAEVDRMRGHFEVLGAKWQCRFAVTGQEATAALAAGAFDAVIVSADLSGTTGIQLIDRLAVDFPKVARILRHADDEKKSAGKVRGLPPCYLEHEHDAAELRDILQRAFQLDRWMQADQVKDLLLRMENLPAVPSLYARVLAELRSDDPSIETVGRLVAKDPALTAKMLQLVNSPHFALGRPVSAAVEAVTFLGAERTKALILMASLSLHGNMTPCEGFSQDQFWQHSLAVGTMARNLTKAQTRDAGLADQAFTAGLLHDIGKLLFASNVPSDYGPVLTTANREGVAVHEIEVQAFGTSHSELGAGLLGTWGLPMPVLEALAWHHTPSHSADASFSLLTAVHVADVFDHEKKAADADGVSRLLAEDYLSRLGLAGDVASWRDLCGCPSRPVSRLPGKVSVEETRTRRP